MTAILQMSYCVSPEKVLLDLSSILFRFFNHEKVKLSVALGMLVMIGLEHLTCKINFCHQYIVLQVL